MTNKCAHPACSCTVPEGKMYCSDKCATGNPSDLTRPPQARQDPFPMPSAADFYMLGEPMTFTFLMFVYPLFVFAGRWQLIDGNA